MSLSLFFHPSCISLCVPSSGHCFSCHSPSPHGKPLASSCEERRKERKREKKINHCSSDPPHPLIIHTVSCKLLSQSVRPSVSFFSKSVPPAVMFPDCVSQSSKSQPPDSLASLLFKPSLGSVYLITQNLILPPPTPLLTTCYLTSHSWSCHTPTDESVAALYHLPLPCDS